MLQLPSHGQPVQESVHGQSVQEGLSNGNLEVGLDHDYQLSERQLRRLLDDRSMLCKLVTWFLIKEFVRVLLKPDGSNLLSRAVFVAIGYDIND
jgi:hypothetical protein